MAAIGNQLKIFGFYRYLQLDVNFLRRSQRIWDHWGCYLGSENQNNGERGEIATFQARDDGDLETHRDKNKQTNTERRECQRKKVSEL